MTGVELAWIAIFIAGFAFYDSHKAKKRAEAAHRHAWSAQIAVQTEQAARLIKERRLHVVTPKEGA